MRNLSETGLLIHLVRTSILTLIVLSACREDATEPQPPASVADVTVEPDSAAIRVGHTLQMTATLHDSAGNLLGDRPVSWSVSDDNLVILSSSGVATGLAPGNVRVTATVEGVSDSTLLTVLIPVSQTRVVPDTVTLVPGGSFQVMAVVTGPNGEVLSGRPHDWFSSEPAVATVSTDGIVTAGVPGLAIVEVTSEGVGGAAARIAVSTAIYASIGGGSAAFHTCALTEDATVYCWGDNSWGQLGNGTSRSESDSNAMLTFPTGIASIAQIVSVSVGGGVTCAVRDSGSRAAYCWGLNESGRLGDGTLDRRSSPVPLDTDLEWLTVTPGFQHVCALATDSLPYCWGKAPGAPGGIFNSVPTPVPNPPRMSALAAGRDYTCGLGNDSLVYCWGLGALGNGTSAGNGSPTPVEGNLRGISITAGFEHACAIAVDSLAYCWGENEFGQLGTGDTKESPGPTTVVGGSRYVQIAAGESFTCALTAAATAECWGSNESAQLGRSTTETCSGRPCATTPAIVNGGNVFSQLVAGAEHACGLTTSGLAVCWGLNASGQLGDGTTVNRALPVRVRGQP